MIGEAISGTIYLTPLGILALIAVVAIVAFWLGRRSGRR